MTGAAPADPTTGRGAAAPAADRADIVVYAATSAGVTAAVAARERGADVLLVEPGRHVGGMTSGGLGYTDLGDARALAGAAVRFREAVARYYGAPVGRFAGPEPHAAETICREWIETAGVRLVQDAALDSAVVADGVIGGLRLADGRTVEGGCFIDASYEGDLMAAVGVPFAVGRDGSAAHGEALAGRREPVAGRHNFPGWISPFADDPDGHEPGPLLAGIKPGPMAPVGAGDGGVMAYQYRVCLTTGPGSIPLDSLAAGDPADWELGRRLFRHWRDTGFTPPAGRLIGLEPNLPHGKCDANSLGPFSLNLLDGSAWAYPTADRAARERIVARHRAHTTGFLAFLATDPAVPAQVRREIAGWGLPGDEFADTGHLPHQLYVREARRMRGAYVLTAHDLLAGRRFGDAVAMGSYHMDVREVQRTWRWAPEHPRPRAMVVTEGYLSWPVPLYQIPYRCLVPEESDCANLIVPVCLSASHLAFSSVRMEVQYQMLGEVAGKAAALALEAGRGVQAVDPPSVAVLPAPGAA
ncbi:MAG: FAD-dependent oxidoreductase [Bifidobacteriaceae bacterium]|nr:FAD-dependent oxidoreductase [Bifidobacteriaceae bacterium]